MVELYGLPNQEQIARGLKLAWLGPFRARGSSIDDTIHLFPGEKQPSWVFTNFERFGSPLKDFVILSKNGTVDPREKYHIIESFTGKRQIGVRAYRSQCMKTTLVQLLPNTHVIEEHFENGEKLRSINAKAIVTAIAEDHLEDDSPWLKPIQIAESITVIDHNSRPIAQTVHTDHLDVRFEESPQMNLLTMLFICVYAGPFDLLLSVSGGGSDSTGKLS